MRIAGKVGLILRFAIILIMALAMLSFLSGGDMAVAAYTWAWQNPLPQGNTLYGISSLDANHVWAVGEYGTILFYNGSSWSSQASGITTTLRGVFVLDTTHVWAVGDSGIILFYNGTSWQEQTSGTGNILRSVSGCDTSHIWAVGDSATIRFNNGGSANWTSQSAPSGVSDALNSVSAYDASNVWAAGNNGRILFYDGTTWNLPEQATGYTDDLAGISVSDTTAAHKVSASAGSNGSVTPTAQWVLHGGTAVINITANSGYHISSITDNTVGQSITNPYVINDVQSPHNISVTFAADPTKYTVTATVSGGNGTAAPDTQQVVSGGAATINFTPASDYHVNSVSDNGTPVTPTPTTSCVIGSVTSAHNVLVTFTANTTEREVSASVSGGHGTVLPSRQAVANGGTATIHMTPDPGCHIDTVTDNGVLVDPTPSDPYVITNVTEIHNVVVTFALDSQKNVYASVVGGNGTVSPDAQLVDSGGTATIDITPDDNYHIGSITDSGAAKPITDEYEINGVVSDHIVVVTFVPDSHVWAVGADGRILFYDGDSLPGNKWQRQTSGTTNRLESVTALDADNAWAVGPTGQILHWNGTAWSSQASGNTNQLRHACALDGSHVWAVGNYGTILFYNGTSWSSQSSGITKQLNGISDLDTTHVWSVGNAGTINFHNGSSWSAQASGTSEDLCAVSALDSSHVWAVGNNGTIRFFNGSSWGFQNSGTTNNLYGVSALNANAVWAVGDTGTILFFNGTSWDLEASGTTNPLRGVNALDFTPAYTVGASVSGGHGTVSPASQQIAQGGTASIIITPDANYYTASVTDNGNPVTPTSSTSYIFNNVTANHNVVVTFALTTVTYTVNASVSASGHGTVTPASQQVNPGGNATITMSPSSGYHLASITDNGEAKTVSNPYIINNVTAAHNVEVAFTSGAQTFTVTASAPQGHGTASPATQQINQGSNATITITADAGYHVASITDNGAAVAVSKPYVISKVAAAHTVMVKFTADSHVWAVGDTGKILFYNDSGSPAVWVSQTSSTTNNLNGVSALNSTHVWAVGNSGTIRFFNGTSWVTQTSGVSSKISSVSAVDINYVWAVGDSGAIRYYDNSSWTAQESGTYNALAGVSARDANHIWAAGTGGTILFGSSDIPTYEVAASVAGDNGTVSPDFQYPAQGGTATINIYPDTGYHLSSITDNGIDKTPTRPYVITNVNEPHDVVVTFTADATQYMVTASVGGGSGWVAPTSQQPAAGGTATIDIHPDPGFHVAHIADNTVEMPLTLSYVLNNVLMDHNVVVAFAAGSQTNTVTASVPGGHGTALPASQPINYGSDATIAITPGGGYHVASVTDNGSPVTPVPTTSYTISNVTVAHTVVVTFAAGSQTNTVNASVSGGHGNISPSTQQINYGAGATINITPDGGYHVASVTDNGSPVTPVPTTSYVINNVTVAHTVVVTFAVDGQAYTVTASVSGGHGTVSPPTQQVNQGASASIAITPDADYHIASITDNGGAAGIANPFVISNVQANHEVVVTFAAGAPTYTFYFAEGYTGDGFDEWLCIMNPGGSSTTAHITYMFTDGKTQNQDVNIGATSRATVDVNSAVGPGKNVSVKVVSNDPIVAERPMYFNYKNKWTGGHDVMGASSPQKTFYFAEGYTGAGAFDEWLCLANPNTKATTAHVTYMFTDGTTQNQDVGIGSTSRSTVDVNAAVGANKNVSVAITADDPIVAERPMYFNYKNKWTGGHDVMGASSPQKTFYFAEGYTGAGAFDEWLCLANPNTKATTAHVTYMFTDGTTQNQDVGIGSTSRSTVDVNAAVGANKNVSVAITADDPIVAERPMYFNYKNKWTGGHDVMGASSPQKTFYFAEGYTGAGAFDEWLCLANPNTKATTAHVTYMFTDGTTQNQDVGIGSTSRSTVDVNAAVGANKNVSVAITADDPIVAERPMYFNYKNKWTGGHNVMGYTP